MGVSDRLAARILRRLPRDLPAFAARHRGGTVVGVAPAATIAASGSDALGALGRLDDGVWAGFAAFELGHAVERVRARGASLEEPAVPDLLLGRFDDRVLIGHEGDLVVESDFSGGPGRGLIDEALAAVADDGAGPTFGEFGDDRDRVPWRSSLARNEYADRVRAVLALLADGECYQVNVTRRLTRDGALEPVELYGALAAHHAAPHAAFFRVPHDGRPIAVVSASPERFLLRSGDRVETRPIKGTARSEHVLRSSGKDNAEHVMIVDLARNDLGRVCRHGSVKVPSLCAAEEHPGLVHLVSTVQGRLRDGVGFHELVAATFPPASVTGAPKPRVLQAIEDLEPVRRGVYCGALGVIDTREPRAELSVAIRTFTVFGEGDDGVTQLGVGGGIVADSTPDAEWEETELKAARLLATARAITSPVAIAW